MKKYPVTATIVAFGIGDSDEFSLLVRKLMMSPATALPGHPGQGLLERVFKLREHG